MLIIHKIRTPKLKLAKLQLLDQLHDHWTNNLKLEQKKGGYGDKLEAQIIII